MTHGSENAIATAALAIVSLTGWLSDKDWERMIGPWGGMLISLAMLVLLVRHSAKRIAKEDARSEKEAAERERRHKEQLDAMKETHAKFESLHIRSMDTQLETAKALLKLSHSCEMLHSEMRGRPCQVTRRDIPPMPTAQEL